MFSTSTFSSFPQNLFDMWTSFPMVGPNREHLEKMQNLQASWGDFLQSNIKYFGLGQVFWKNFSEEFPKYCQSNMDNFFKEDAATKMQNGLQFFDQCWEKTMRSQEYAQVSAETLNNLGKLRAQMMEFVSPILQNSNIASLQQIQELSQQVDALSKKIETLEAQKQC